VNQLVYLQVSCLLVILAAAWSIQAAPQEWSQQYQQYASVQQSPAFVEASLNGVQHQQKRQRASRQLLPVGVVTRAADDNVIVSSSGLRSRPAPLVSSVSVNIPTPTNVEALPNGDFTAYPQYTYSYSVSSAHFIICITSKQSISNIVIVIYLSRLTTISQETARKPKKEEMVTELTDLTLADSQMVPF
jgi:hypothetical protein